MIGYLERKLPDRKVLLAARCGSKNYNIDIANSDTDYRAFSISNISKGTRYWGEGTDDFMVYDISTFKNGILRMEPKFIELLFSDLVITNKSLYKDIYIEELFSLKDKIITMNLPQMYSGYKENIKTHIELIENADNIKHLVKYMVHLYRISDILEKFYKQHFKDYQSCLVYKDDNSDRKFLIDLKHGNIERSLYEEIITEKLKNVDRLKCTYMENEIDNKTIEIVNKLFTYIGE